jgi:DNA helicase-2/ATP-dependent DNA helicase PcrA
MPSFDAIDDPFAALNAQQREAAQHGIGECPAGPLLVIAGAGSGKTSTLAARVARLVLAGADPQRILLLTFSRRAAAELERRAGAFLSRVGGRAAAEKAPALRWAGTFHGVGARLLREYAARVGLHEGFSILDRGDAEDLLALVRHETGLGAAKQRFPGAATCLAIYSRVVNGGLPLADVLAHAFPWCARWETELRELFASYVETKQGQNVLDYDDLLLYWAEMLASPSLAREIGARFDHVLVDEYQDTNLLQASILRALKPDGAGVTAVGDDAQSIYSFRAATIRNILDFPHQFGQPVRMLTLERNYRSTQSILEASNAVIGLARERYAKNLWSERLSSARPRLVAVPDETEQARYVALRVLERRERGFPLRAQAVLFRSASHGAQLELELARRDIPFVKYGGLRFLEAAHVKDVLAVMRFGDNLRHRIAGFRAVRLLPGIGPTTATKVLDAVAAAPEPLAALGAVIAPTAAAADWPAFVSLLRSLGTPIWPAELDAVVAWYAPHLERIYDDAFVRAGDLAVLRQIASTYASRERFLTELALDPPEVTSDEAGAPARDDDYLILSTIHSAKGQEWRAVNVLNVVDGCIPSDMATGTTEEVEEERRLLYVAMTRARDELELTVPQRFFVRKQTAYGDRHVYASRSRFIPETLIPLFETDAWPLAAADANDAAPRCSDHASVDVVARVRALWR